MIEQKAIFEAAQTAFEAAHPKFPFPKKNNLEEQTPDFQKAFLMFSTDINAMHEKEIETVARGKNELREELRECKEIVYDKTRESIELRTALRDVRKERDRSQAYLVLFGVFLTAFSLVAAVLIFFAWQMSYCIPQFQAEQFDFRFTDSVVAYDVFGNASTTPVCKLI